MILHTPDEPQPRGVLDAVLERLETMVVEDLHPGDSLPSESHLAALLGVSRLTVREAVRMLTARGLVAVSKGRRPVVLDQNNAALTRHFRLAVRRDPRGLIELNGVRMLLEVMGASLAAHQASRAALGALDASLDRMSESAKHIDGVSDPNPSALEGFHAADLDFHESLGLASGNRMLAQLLESLGNSLHNSFVATAKSHFARGGTVADVVDAHRRILDAVKAGDADGAAAAMRKHLHQAERDLRANFANLDKEVPGNDHEGSRR